MYECVYKWNLFGSLTNMNANGSIITGTANAEPFLEVWTDLIRVISSPTRSPPVLSLTYLEIAALKWPINAPQSKLSSCLSRFLVVICLAISHGNNLALFVFLAAICILIWGLLIFPLTARDTPPEWGRPHASKMILLNSTVFSKAISLEFVSERRKKDWKTLKLWNGAH